MADNLVKLMDETGYRQLINMLISIKSNAEAEVEKCISVWQPNTMYQKDKVVLVVNDNTYSEYICKATHMSGETFEETYWTLVSCVEFEGYTEEELLAMLNLTEEELDNLQNLINNDEVQNDHVWSSSKVYAELLTVLSESKNFTIAEIAKIVSFSYKVVSSESEVVDDKAIYLIENSTTGTYDMYLLVDGSPSKIGNTNINLEGYVKKEDIVDTFDETTIYADSDKVFSTKAVKSAYDDLNDKKISKSNIVTTLDNTVTNEQIPSAKAIYDGLDKKITKDNIIELGDIGNGSHGYVETWYDDDINSNFISLTLKDPNGKIKKIQFNDNENDTTIGMYHNSGTNWTYLGRCCMTKVSDIPTTSITTFEDSRITGGTVFYTVKNGICYVNLWCINCNAVAQSIVVLSTLPKASINVICTLGQNLESILGIAYINQDSRTLMLNSNASNLQSFGSFSYPVAEE